jgi:hypothetical protein
MSHPVTRAELIEVLDERLDQRLTERLAPFVTKDYLDERLDERLASFATKEDLDEQLERFATKEDLERFATKENLEGSLRAIAKQIEEIPGQILAELRTFVAGIQDQNRLELRAVDDPYRDLPARVTRLEEAVFSPPAPKRPKRKLRGA